jgi:hypothetical protein
MSRSRVLTMLMLSAVGRRGCTRLSVDGSGGAVLAHHAGMTTLTDGVRASRVSPAPDMTQRLLHIDRPVMVVRIPHELQKHGSIKATKNKFAKTLYASNSHVYSHGHDLPDHPDQIARFGGSIHERHSEGGGSWDSWIRCLTRSAAWSTKCSICYSACCSCPVGLL